MSAKMTEDTLVQQTTADYLHDEVGWDSIFAYNEETFGPEGTLGRQSDKEVVLTRYLDEALLKLNPGLPEPATVPQFPASLTTPSPSLLCRSTMKNTNCSRTVSPLNTAMIAEKWLSDGSGYSTSTGRCGISV